MAETPKPFPNNIYLHDQSIHTHETTLTSLTPFHDLPSTDKPLFKTATEDDFILTTASTIFFPQGGGQPSDIGRITFDPSSTSDPSSETSNEIQISLVRTSISPPSRILHLARLPAPSPRLKPSLLLTQHLSSSHRNLNSRYHTAGHLLSLCVLSVVPDVFDSKASHYPAAAFVEFKGLIDGSYKDAIQAKVDEMVAKALSVNVHWWGEAIVRERCSGGVDGIEGLLEEINNAGDEDGGAKKLLRAVEIEGLGSYPCGGTHLPSTIDIGKVEVRKIKRQRGISKVSYSVS